MGGAAPRMGTGGWVPCRVVPFDGSSTGRQVGPPGALECLFGDLRLPGPPFRMQRTPLTPGPAPRLGQHAREVIVDILGHTEADIGALRLDRSP